MSAAGPQVSFPEPTAADPQAREQLVQQHMAFARILAARLYAQRWHDEVGFEDYLQLACVGLLEAVDRFEPARGVQFRTFAAKRIQGAVLNGLERLTERNQQAALHRRLRLERMQSLKEPAEEAKDPQDALFRRLAEVGIGLALGMLLEDSGMVAPASPQAEAVGVSPEVSYFRKAELRQLGEVLRALLQRLPEQERSVLWQHYLQEIPFEAIALRLGLSRARISQLHRRGLHRLQQMAQHNPLYEAFL